MISLQSVITTCAAIIFLGLFLGKMIIGKFIESELDGLLERMSKASNRAQKISPLPGFIGKLALVVQISAGITFSKRAMKSGAMTLEELQCIPAIMKRKLKAIFWVYTTLFIGLVITGAAIKLTGLR